MEVTEDILIGQVYMVREFPSLANQTQEVRLGGEGLNKEEFYCLGHDCFV